MTQVIQQTGFFVIEVYDLSVLELLHCTGRHGRDNHFPFISLKPYYYSSGDVFFCFRGCTTVFEKQRGLFLQHANFVDAQGIAVNDS